MVVEIPAHLTQPVRVLQDKTAALALAEQAPVETAGLTPPSTSSRM
jgi:hypothetical protein